MRTSAGPINCWLAPRQDELGNTVEDFLQRLGGPTWIKLPGRDTRRCRAVSTLLHGNEPSGAKAVFKYLKSGARPAVNSVFFLGAVSAALEPPGFNYRHFPGVRDLNRCFRAPFHDEPGAIAQHLLMLLHDEQPESLIDIHNTSGAGPDFSVAVKEDRKHDILAGLFTRRQIITDIRVGALMELAEQNVPTVTIECGGARDPAADRVAETGLWPYLETEDLFALDSGPMEILTNPLRLELTNEASVGYAEAADERFDLTLPYDVEKWNFRQARPGDRLGWIQEKGLRALSIKDGAGVSSAGRFFVAEQGELRFNSEMTVFMVTTDPAIARSDCILYFVPKRHGLFDSSQ